MEEQGTRPPAWKFALGAVLAFGAWQVVSHLWLMRFRMGMYHTISFCSEVVIALVAAGLVYRTSVRYQTRLENLNAELERKNNELGRVNDLKDSLTAMIVHDLRSPLSGALCAMELIARGEIEDRAKATRYAQIALLGGKRLMDMINCLLDLTKLEAGEMKMERARFDFAEIVSEACSEMRPMVERRQQELSIREPPQPLWVAADKGLAERVVNNLLSNAIKITPEGGYIKVEWYRSGGSSFIEVSVQDNGPGIPRDYHEKIFEKFGTVETRQPGTKVSTGLGLTFCRLAVEAHGGKIWLESEEGRGSTFHFTLPEAPGEEPRSSAPGGREAETAP